MSSKLSSRNMSDACIQYRNSNIAKRDSADKK